MSLILVSMAWDLKIRRAHSRQQGIKLSPHKSLRLGAFAARGRKSAANWGVLRKILEDRPRRFAPSDDVRPVVGEA
jgi:hypothetical protein